ncbi:MAG TPA: hypothetical protein V6C88_11140 [Chroococcidiopsis sp.]
MAKIIPAPDSFCFCTAVFGQQYIQLAKLLASDLLQFAPDHWFVVLTDAPSAFIDYPNVFAVKHWCRGVLPYNERRFAIQQALAIAPSTMYLDADVRICAPLPTTLQWQPGLTARSCGALQKHLKEQFDRTSLEPDRLHKKWVIEQMFQKAGIDITEPNLKFINEFLFVVTADDGREQEFLRLWGEMAVYADTLGMHKHPTYAMAIAAFKSGLPVYRDEMVGLDFFDDRVERVLIQEGKSSPDAKAEYFQQQSRIEQQPSPLSQRLMRRVLRQSALIYNRARVQLTAATMPSRLINYAVKEVKLPLASNSPGNSAANSAANSAGDRLPIA